LSWCDHPAQSVAVYVASLHLVQEQGEIVQLIGINEYFQWSD
jgi:hypothetical protein